MYFLVFFNNDVFRDWGLQYAQKHKTCQEKWSKSLLNKLFIYCIINKILDCEKSNYLNISTK